MNMPKRSTTNKRIAGVCGGLAEHYNVSASLIRAGFLLLMLPGGVPGPLLYILLVLIMPADQRPNYPGGGFYTRTNDLGSDYKDTIDI
jgi:phage shock protein C